MGIKNICFIDYCQKRDCFPVQLVQEIEKKFDMDVYTFTFKPVGGLNGKSALLLFTREIGGVIPEAEKEKAEKIAAKYSKIFVTTNVERKQKCVEALALFRPSDYCPDSGYVERVGYVSLPDELRKLIKEGSNDDVFR